MLHSRHQAVGVVSLPNSAPYFSSPIVMEEGEGRLVAKDRILPLLVPRSALLTPREPDFDVFFLSSGFLQAGSGLATRAREGQK
jgi:hypothetical protein